MKNTNEIHTVSSKEEIEGLKHYAEIIAATEESLELLHDAIVDGPMEYEDDYNIAMEALERLRTKADREFQQIDDLIHSEARILDALARRGGGSEDFAAQATH